MELFARSCTASRRTNRHSGPLEAKVEARGNDKTREVYYAIEGNAKGKEVRVWYHAVEGRPL